MDVYFENLAHKLRVIETHIRTIYTNIYFNHRDTKSCEKIVCATSRVIRVIEPRAISN